MTDQQLFTVVGPRPEGAAPAGFRPQGVKTV